MRDIGAERNLSKVRILLSIGMEAGPILLADQKTVCAARTGMSLSGGMLRPTEKVKNRATGKRMPNITFVYGHDAEYLKSSMAEMGDAITNPLNLSLALSRAASSFKVYDFQGLREKEVWPDDSEEYRSY